MTCMIPLTPLALARFFLYAFSSIDDHHRWVFSIFQSISDTTFVFMCFIYGLCETCHHLMLVWFVVFIHCCSFSPHFCCLCSRQWWRRRRWNRAKNAYYIQLIRLKIIKSNCLNALLSTDRYIYIAVHHLSHIGLCIEFSRGGFERLYEIRQIMRKYVFVWFRRSVS